GKGLSRNEMEIASQHLKLGSGIKFYHISDYRNLLTVKKNKLTALINNVPPHENVGQNFDELLKDIKNIDVLNEFVENNKITINNNDYMFYPWGVSEKIKLPEFSALHNKSCSCVCCAEIVKGIAKCMNIDLAELNNATGDTDTDLVEKASAVLNEIKSHDVVIAHINGTDEVSHRKDLVGKIKFIEKIDREFLSIIYENADRNTKIIIVSDHQTSSQTGKHEKGSVDLIMNITKKEIRGTSIWLE
ncbi:MAG: phosphoglycerate mutase, partial [Sedimentibacter sp.]|nr:phosphoglycerate mutase [Sedimentibacter sp.]